MQEELSASSSEALRGGRLRFQEPSWFGHCWDG